MTAKENIVVLFANPYDMTDEKTGKRTDGISVSYLYGTSLSPLINADHSLGQRPAKGSVSTSLWDKFVAAPGLYEGSFEMSIGGNGKPTLKLVDVNWLSNVETNIVSDPETVATNAMIHANGGKK